MGSDTARPENGGLKDISIHAPRMGSDNKAILSPLGERAFQSTLPAWGATPGRAAVHVGIHHFNPRSPHGERRRGARSAGETSQISIHAPRMGSDQMENETMRLVLAFQSTLPAWGATRFRQRGQGRRSDFNPRSPHGERRQQLHAGHPQRAISIHAPRMGSDNRESAGDAHSLYFNPRSPHGERPVRNVCDCF